MEKPYYEVILTHDINDWGKRLTKPKSFKWKTREEAQNQVSHLRKQGIKKHWITIYLRD